jgi:hypothetical protein
VRDLAATAADPSVRDIVIANQPFRVHGASLAGDFEAALSLSGSRVVPVHSLCWVSYETVRSGTLAPGPSGAAPGLRLAVPRRPYSRFVGPRPPPGAARLRTPFGVIEHADDVGEGGDAIWTLWPEAAPGRAILVWSAGRLRPFQGAREIVAAPCLIIDAAAVGSGSSLETSIRSASSVRTGCSPPDATISGAPWRVRSLDR